MNNAPAHERGPAIVARRWDGMGGRISALLNTWSVSRALGLEFQFVWPENLTLGLKDPQEVFSAAFIARHLISESGLQVVPVALDTVSVAAAREQLIAGNAEKVGIGEELRVFAFADECPDVAMRRFRAGMHEIGWSPALEEQIARMQADAGLAALPAVHIRAGDIVYGSWRQFVPVEKYMPLALAEFAISHLAGPDKTPVLIISDNARLVAYLKTRFPRVLSPGDVLAGYRALTPTQQAFAELFLMSRANRVVVPRLSGFSWLAGQLGGNEIEKVCDLIAEDDAMRLFLDRMGPAGKEAARHPFLRPLVARDLCWFLDVFSDRMHPDEVAGLARRALRQDPDFCGALNRHALAVAGNPRRSAHSSRRAGELAKEQTHHDDPLLESLAHGAAACALGIAQPSRRGLMRLLGRGGFRSYPGRRTKDSESTRILQQAKQTLERCEALAPFQTRLPDVLMNLRYQIAAMEWLAGPPDKVKTIAQDAIFRAGRERTFLREWRPPGFEVLRSHEIFPQIVRNLEAASVIIARSIGIALLASRQAIGPPSHGHIDAHTLSDSGLLWVNGWAFEAGSEGRDFAVGYAADGGVAAGGVPFLPRPDVSDAFQNPMMETCGFAFPVPPGSAGPSLVCSVLRE